MFTEDSYSTETIRNYPKYVNWDFICKYQSLSIEEIEEFKEHIPWAVFSSYCDKDEVLDRFENFICWKLVGIVKQISERSLRKYFDRFDIKVVSSNQVLSEGFIRDYAERLDWSLISCKQNKLSENIIREFSDKVVWYKISYYQKLSESFIREFKDKVDWKSISYNQKLSEDFIREFVDKVDWHTVSRYQELSKAFIYEFYEKIDLKKILMNERVINGQKLPGIFKDAPKDFKLTTILKDRDLAYLFS